MEKFLNAVKNIIIGLIKTTAVFAVVGAILFLFYFSIDYIFKDLLPYTSRAVLANFIIFAAIIIYLLLFLAKTPLVMQKMQDEVVDAIKTSENTKSESEKELDIIENSLSHIEDDINTILSESERNVALVGEKILDDAQKSAITIRENTQKSIENNKNLLKNELIKRASLASIEVAKENIINELNDNEGLHNKFIDESIEAINGVEL